MKTQVSSDIRGGTDDQEYSQFLSRINERFRTNTNNGTLPVFTTDATGLFNAYLGGIPEKDRQHHTCHACREFVNSYGGLVVISTHGRIVPAIWNEEDASIFYWPAVEVVSKIIRHSRVTGVFIPSRPEYGKSCTGVWQHLSVMIPTSMLYRGVVKRADEVAAEKLEDYRNVRRALAEFSASQLDQALALLQTDSLYRSEKVLGPVQWLRNLHQQMANEPGHQCKDNVVWLNVATAPTGFCHPRSSMAWSLLGDIASGLDLESVSRRFAEKMHPLQYQRPQAAPSAGTIAQAEKIVEQLKAAGSLERRFARLDEIETIWRPPTPTKQPESTGGVFGHLTPKGDEAKSSSNLIPTVTISWDKFFRTVLSSVNRIQYHVPFDRQSYAVLVTAVNPEAPPILQWDTAEQRNPVSWYLRVGGSYPTEFGLTAGELCEVDAVTFKPSMWFQSSSPQHGLGVIFVLKGARETIAGGNALFPEILKAEFHGIRSVIEAYSQSAKIVGLSLNPCVPHACGLMLNSGSVWGQAKFRVTSGAQVVDYLFDRWD